MAASNVNVVVITGNLTKDPELRATGGGTSVCEMRVAVNSRRKQGEEWVDKPNYFDVVVFGKQADNCAQYLSRGRPVAVEGRLDFQEWEAKEGGGKRSKVVIIVNTIQFLNSREDGGAQPGGGSDYNSGYANQGGETGGGYQPPAQPGGGGGQEDDIPF